MVFSNSRPKSFWRQRSKFAKLQCDQHRLYLLLCRLHVQTYCWHFQERYTLRLWDSNPHQFYYFTLFLVSESLWLLTRDGLPSDATVETALGYLPLYVKTWTFPSLEDFKSLKTLFQRDEDEQSSVGEARENITDWMRGASKKFSLKSWHQLWTFPNVASANLYLSTPGIPINLIIKC